MNTKRVGNIGESAIIAEFVALGLPVFLPFGDNEVCDLVVDFGGKLQKIQVKTTENASKTYVRFKLNSRRYGADYKYQPHEVDYFALYCIETKQSYLFKNSEYLNTRSINLRFSKPKNGQEKNVRYAEDYLLSEYFR